MEHFICQVSVAPVRSSFSDRSEMVTQLLFGETVTLLSKRDNWCKILGDWDGYVGWTDDKLLRPITAEEFEAYKYESYYSLELAQAAMADDHFLPILMGSTLPNYDGMRLDLGDLRFTFNGQVISPANHALTEERLLKIARKYLNAPYLWGGRSPFGIDCSGFSQIVFKMLGIPLLRDASQQVTQGRVVDFVEQAHPGDLAFFENKKKRIAHVGIVFPEGKIAHAHGKVRIDTLDHFGIFNQDTQNYTHQLRVIKRVLPDDMTRSEAAQKADARMPQHQMGLF